jgi:hypothetical protein
MSGYELERLGIAQRLDDAIAAVLDREVRPLLAAYQALEGPDVMPPAVADLVAECVAAIGGTVTQERDDEDDEARCPECGLPMADTAGPACECPNEADGDPEEEADEAALDRPGDDLPSAEPDEPASAAATGPPAAEPEPPPAEDSSQPGPGAAGPPDDSPPPAAAPAPGGDRNAATNAANRDAVLQALREASTQWIGPGAIARASRLSGSTVKRHLTALVDAGTVEHNGHARAASKYRLTPEPEPEPEAAPEAPGPEPGTKGDTGAPAPRMHAIPGPTPNRATPPPPTDNERAQYAQLDREVYGVLKDGAEWSTIGIARCLVRNRDDVRAALVRLEASGAIKGLGDGIWEVDEARPAA